MAEWSKAIVLKTIVSETGPWVRIPPPPFVNKKEEINKDMVSYYRDRAEEYDKGAYEANKRPEIQPDIQATTRILQEVFAGKSVLEIAAGTGFWTEKIAQTARSITATDINQSMVNVARTKQYPKGNVTFRAADLYTLDGIPLHEGLFGGFIFSHILKQDLNRFIDTINKYVVPGGTIVLMDNNRKINQNQDRTDEHGNNYRLRTLEDGSKHEIVKNYPTEQELKDLLRTRSTGIDFKNLEYYWILIYRTPLR